MDWALWASANRTKKGAPPPLAETDVFTLGENKFGQLGVPDDVVGAKCINAGGCTQEQWLNDDKVALTAARNTLVQPPHDLYGDYVASVSCAENQTILLTYNGRCAALSSRPRAQPPLCAALGATTASDCAGGR